MKLFTNRDFAQGIFGHDKCRSNSGPVLVKETGIIYKIIYTTREKEKRTSNPWLISSAATAKEGEKASEQSTMNSVATTKGQLAVSSTITTKEGQKMSEQSASAQEGPLQKKARRQVNSRPSSGRP
jgi:hypothetical protein